MTHNPFNEFVVHLGKFWINAGLPVSDDGRIILHSISKNGEGLNALIADVHNASKEQAAELYCMKHEAQESTLKLMRAEMLDGHAIGCYREK